MQRRSAAEGDHHAIGDVLAVLDRMNAGGVRHVLVDHLADAEGSRDRFERKRPADIAIDRPFGRLTVQLDGAASEIVGVELAEHQVCVGDRRAIAAAIVAGRSGLRAGALRSGLDPSHRIDPGDRAAAGPDLDHLDDRDRDRHPRALAETVGARDLEGARGAAARSPRSGRSLPWCRPYRRTPPCRDRNGGRCRPRRCAPPAGPDSTRRTGNSDAVSTEISPPPEWIMNTGHSAPMSRSRRCRRAR